MNARPQAWLSQANNDLAMARLATDNGFHAQACYFAAQAAEKALKGALLELGREPPHTHVLPDLVAALRDQGVDVDELVELPLKALTRMTITSRNPIDATPPSELFESSDAVQALATAGAVIALLERLDQPAP
ncbi:HEPN domain-containing protein [Cyanobium sp. ATX 6F1]|uniref:HEPN domain-containing protein n=1 Tax=unclassified Cyanobium TaxID=2627006 RepID=UPI0020CC288E|nr:HEPN domain-containing protein [Cyanobium sp. ATX 6F1]MCP9915859.1 HEPN domain-containing protein [Cyanobium sp. ATX 6F1]